MQSINKSRLLASLLALAAAGCVSARTHQAKLDTSVEVRAAIDSASAKFPLDSLVRLSTHDARILLSTAIRRLPVAATVDPTDYPIDQHLDRPPSGIRQVPGLTLTNDATVRQDSSQFSLYIAFVGDIASSPAEVRVLFFLSSDAFAAYLTSVRLTKVGGVWRVTHASTLAQ